MVSESIMVSRLKESLSCTNKSEVFTNQLASIVKPNVAIAI